MMSRHQIFILSEIIVVISHQYIYITSPNYYIQCMRITITLDRDVEKRFDELAGSSSETKRSLLNRLLRNGMDSLEREKSTGQKIVKIKSRDLGRCKYPSLDNISEVLSAAEGDTFK